MIIKESMEANVRFIIQTRNLCRHFKVGRSTIHALDKVSIHIEKGVLTILKGRSGSGKTTLLNLLGGLDMPDKGNILFNGTDITLMNQHGRDKLRRNKMGFVFQSIALIPMTTAFENVDFGLRIADYKASDRKNRAQECLELVDLGKRMNHRIHELSGGEQQRVAIARAIAHRPEIVFADEPTGELDTHMGLQVVSVFKTLIEKENMTVLMTTHDPGMMEIADRIYELSDGEIVNNG